jgi:hypothetical protein
MNKEMLLIVPSRGRPQNIKRLCEALLKTKSNVELIVGIDMNDPTADEYHDLALQYGFKLNVSVERKRFAATVNSIALYHYQDYEYLAWMGDDHVPQTEYWDEHYLDALKEAGVGVVYGNDLVQGENIATELAFTSNIVGALGYAIPEGFVHLFVDNYFMELGKAVDRLIYLPNIIVQHMHYSTGYAQEDLTYREANSPENWSNDERRFHEYVAKELPSDAEKLRKLL